MKQLHSLSEPTSQLLDDLEVCLQTDNDECLADSLGGVQSLCSVSFALSQSSHPRDPSSGDKRPCHS